MTRKSLRTAAAPLPPAFGNERGLTLVYTMIPMTGLLGLAISGMVTAVSGARVSRNFKNGTQAILAAEAGVAHARTAISNRFVSRFDVQVAWREH